MPISEAELGDWDFEVAEENCCFSTISHLELLNHVHFNWFKNKKSFKILHGKIQFKKTNKANT